MIASTLVKYQLQNDKKCAFTDFEKPRNRTRKNRNIGVNYSHNTIMDYNIYMAMSGRVVQNNSVKILKKTKTIQSRNLRRRADTAAN